MIIPMKVQARKFKSEQTSAKIQHRASIKEKYSVNLNYKHLCVQLVTNE